MTDYEYEHESLGRAAFAAVVASGADTDGARTWKEYFRPIVSPSWEDSVRADVETAIKDLSDDLGVAQAKLAAIAELCESRALFVVDANQTVLEAVPLALIQDALTGGAS